MYHVVFEWDNLDRFTADNALDDTVLTDAEKYGLSLDTVVMTNLRTLLDNTRYAFRMPDGTVETLQRDESDDKATIDRAGEKFLRIMKGGGIPLYTTAEIKTAGELSFP
jgi:hypothetical protein